MSSFIRTLIRAQVQLACALALMLPFSAIAALSITPLTWNVVGLDSNNVSVGPNLFPIGGRRPYKLKVRVKADFGRRFLFYIVPSSNSTRWREVRVAAAEAKP